MKYLRYIVEEIHTTVVASNDNDGLPVTCAIDMMDYDETGLYFLTAKGKSFYDRLKRQGFIAFTGMKGEDTMSCVAVSFRGKVKEIGSERLERLFEKNPYMKEIYPDKSAYKALTVFKIYEGAGEWYDLSKLPIERASFSLGEAEEVKQGYLITDKCIGCGECLTVCPMSCIDLSRAPAVIKRENCAHCGNCMNICPANAVAKY